MKAVAITPHTTGMALIDAPEPVISAPDQVKLKVIRVGICRNQRKGGRLRRIYGAARLWALQRV